MRIVHPAALKHTRLRGYTDSLFRAQILACQAGTNSTPFPDLHACDCTGTATDAREKICSRKLSARTVASAAAGRVCAPESGEGKISVPAPRRPPALLLLPSTSPAAAPGAGKPGPRCGLPPLPEGHRRCASAVRAAPGGSAGGGARRPPLAIWPRKPGFEDVRVFARRSFPLPVGWDRVYRGSFRYNAIFAHCKSHMLQSNSYQLGGPEQ